MYEYHVKIRSRNMKKLVFLKQYLIVPIIPRTVFHHENGDTLLKHGL